MNFTVSMTLAASLSIGYVASSFSLISVLFYFHFHFDFFFDLLLLRNFFLILIFFEVSKCLFVTDF